MTPAAVTPGVPEEEWTDPGQRDTTSPQEEWTDPPAVPLRRFGLTPPAVAPQEEWTDPGSSDPAFPQEWTDPGSGDPASPQED